MNNSNINAEVKKGTRKGDVIDKSGNLHSVKSGRKWQICLYTLGRISQSLYLSILKPCLESFPDDYDQYLKDRISCISFKEEYVKNHGVDAGKLLPNKTVINSLGENIYITSKYTLQKKTEIISKLLPSLLGQV